jgi:phage-related baseplate assembly protein
MALLNLARPLFLETDPQVIRAGLYDRYESLYGKTLYPGQPESIILDMLAYALTIEALKIQSAAEQNLVQYSSGTILEHIAALYGVVRQPPKKAKTRIRFTADNSVRPVEILIPRGTQVKSKDRKQIFETTADVVIALTDIYNDVDALAVEAGAAANGYAPGSISEPLVAVAFIENVSNITISEGGADIESDDQLRERVVKAPESFSVAGPTLAYDFWARSAHPAIIDVSVDSSLPGRVEVYPLTTSGSPSQEVIDAVQAMISAEKKRPLTDTVRVLAPTRLAYSISAQVTLYARQPEIEVRLAILAKLNDYAEQKRKKLGRDVVLNHIVALIQSVTGVYDVRMAQPVASLPVAPSEFADCTSISITLTTPANEEPVTYQYS